VALDIWLLNVLINQGIRAQQISFLTFLMGLIVLLSVPVLLVLIYQTASWLTLRYHLDRNGVVVSWVGTEQIIPIRDIQRIVPGREFGGTVVRRRGLRWPGHERGDGLVPGIGRTRFLATQRLEEQLLLVTPGRAFAISPHDPGGFLSAFESRQELGPNRLLEQTVRRPRWLTLPLWTDQTAWTLLGAAVAVNLGLFGYLCLRFPGLDFELPLHFNSIGQADRIEPKVELFALPIIGLIILATNLGFGLLLYRRERAGSYLLWGAAAAVQALFWLAAFSILP
jgi:hypothetical protein